VNVNSEEWDPDKNLKDLKKRSEEQLIKMEQDKEKLKQRILSEWHQHNSVCFWTQCFLNVPLKIIDQVFNNVLDLKSTGYPINNESGFFVAILKRMGYFPWKEEK